MKVLNLSPIGTLEYDEDEVVTSGLGNKANFMIDEIREIKFVEPTFLTNGIIRFKFHNRHDVFCTFNKRRVDEARVVYQELCNLKNNKSTITGSNINYVRLNAIDTPVGGDDIEVSVIKFCPNCGTKIMPNAKFCMECGIQLNLITYDSIKPDKNTNTSSDIDLEDLLEREYEHHNKSFNEEYYFSEEAKIKGKQVYNDKKEYLKQHPDDFTMQGAQIHSIVWSMFDTIPEEEQRIVKLTGEGKYYELMENYEKAIELYKEADNLTMKVCAKDIQELVNEYGPGDYLYTAKIRQRIRVCEKNIMRPKILKMEEDAKKLEKTNPSEAIKIYNHLNELKPGLKKYNKRIEICKRRL